MLDKQDEALADSLTRAGVSGPLRHEVLEPFLAGVLAEPDGVSSAAFARLLLRSFALGAPGVPAAGMQALPEQLARPLSGRITTGITVDEVRAGAQEARVLAADRTWRTEVVVVAVAGESVDALTPLPPVPTKPLTTWWFACDRAPAPLPFLALDGRRLGPVVNALDMTSAAPSYAPPGRRLVQATTLTPIASAGEHEVRAHLDDLYGITTKSWELVARHHIQHALPTQPPPLAVRQPVELSERLFVAGDHCDTASLQGALVSGTRCAHAVLHRFGRPRAR